MARETINSSPSAPCEELVASNLTPMQVSGALGALPVIVAVYTDSPGSGFLLIDGVTGAMDGPFASGTAINPGTLLAAHTAAYTSGSSVQVVSAATGNCHPVAEKWRDTAPPGWTPAPAVPGAPATSPNGRPTHWQDYQCGETPTGKCRCTSSGTGTSGTPPMPATTRVVCLCNGPCPANQPGGHPNVPPPPITAPPGLGGCTCTQQWRY